MAKLTTKQMMDFTMQVCRNEGSLADWIQRIAELHERVKVFEAVVWFPRLQAIVNGTDARGMSGHCRGVDVMTWCCAGRCLIQLATKPGAIQNLHPVQDASLTLITADDEKPWNREMCHVAPGMGPMGIQSIDAEIIDAMVILYTVTRWGDELILKPDENVTIG